MATTPATGPEAMAQWAMRELLIQIHNAGMEVAELARQLGVDYLDFEAKEITSVAKLATQSVDDINKGLDEAAGKLAKIKL